jgi:hypothetical protein
MLGNRCAGEGDDNEEDDEDRARECELVPLEPQPDALPIAAGSDCGDLVVLLRVLDTEEATLEISMEVGAKGSGGRQRVALCDAVLALLLAAFNRVVWCDAHREVKSIAPVLVGS